MLNAQSGELVNYIGMIRNSQFASSSNSGACRLLSPWRTRPSRNTRLLLFAACRWVRQLFLPKSKLGVERATVNPASFSFTGSKSKWEVCIGLHHPSSSSITHTLHSSLHALWYALRACRARFIFMFMYIRHVICYRYRYIYQFIIYIYVVQISTLYT